MLAKWFLFAKEPCTLGHRFIAFPNGAGIRDLVSSLFSLFVVLGLMKDASGDEYLAILCPGPWQHVGVDFLLFRYNDGPLNFPSSR